MTDHYQMLHKSAASKFSIWDAAEIFEYATSRFTKTQHSSSYQHTFVRHIVWEAETEPYYDHGKLFAAFKACPHESPTHPVDINRVVRPCAVRYASSDVCCSVKELVTDHFAQRPKMASMVPTPITHARSDDPLLQQLQVSGPKFPILLDATREAVAALDRLEDPVDELREAMVASHAAVAMLQGHYDNGRLGGPSSVEPFPGL
ncbi:hypothetical protein C8R48DRAFT_675722 [Suillus tomentosus]|nr:hypothetical protein C8R48DRAFT_675722 [Suillus tomentosus]